MRLTRCGLHAVDAVDAVVEGGRSIAAGLRCRRLMRLMRLLREDAQSSLGLHARGMGIVREEQRTEVACNAVASSSCCGFGMVIGVV